METKGERRLRKLKELCGQVEGGHTTVADKAGVSDAYLDQILKGVRLPPKADGTRSPRILGDAAVQKIETAYKLGSGWFDSDENMKLPPELAHAATLFAQVKDGSARAAALQVFETLLQAAIQRQSGAQPRSDTTRRRASGP